MALPHIRTSEKDGRVLLEVDDTELFDFVDDFLTEQCDLDYEHVILGPKRHTIIFPPGTSIETVNSALNQLDANDVERVFRINNSSGPAV